MIIIINYTERTYRVTDGGELEMLDEKIRDGQEQELPDWGSLPSVCCPFRL